MKKEIDNAVDTFHRIAFGSKQNGTKYMSEEKLASFISVLTKLLFARYENNWYPENPDRGSGYRCIRVNTQCIDPTIVESMKIADIKLPNHIGATELTIWVDPGIVSVRIGEDGSIGTEIVDEEVYRLSRMKNTPVKLEKSGSVETDSSSRSSSPEMGYHSDRSLSDSPTFFPSPSQSRSSPVMEYNPYAPPARVSYPSRFQRSVSPPSASMASPPPPKSVSPIRGFPTSMPQPAAPSHIPSVNGSPISFNNAPPAAEFNGSPGLANIPTGQFSHRMSGYTRPRAIFPSTSYSSDQLEKSPSKPQFSAYNMPVNYGHGVNSGNFYDIPVVA